MTDLPYGRGGSPLQNLIKRNIENTKISAIKVVKDLDAGDIYLKRDLNLNGTADEILGLGGTIIKRIKNGDEVECLILGEGITSRNNDTEHTDKTLEALSCYKTEMREYPHPRSLKAVKIASQRWGTVVGCEYIETFELVRSLVD